MVKKRFALKAKLSPETEKKIRSIFEVCQVSGAKLLDNFNVPLGETSEYDLDTKKVLPLTYRVRIKDLEVIENNLVIYLNDYLKTLRITHFLFDKNPDFSARMLIANIANISYSDMKEIYSKLEYLSFEFDGIEISANPC